MKERNKTKSTQNETKAKETTLDFIKTKIVNSNLTCFVSKGKRKFTTLKT